MNVRPLHLVTDDRVVGAADFGETAQRVLAAHGEGIALHLRAHGLETRELFHLALELAFASAPAGARLLVNDRVDIALAAGADGVQLGRRSLPVDAARELLGADAWIGYSAHAAGEAESAAERGADFVLVGTIYASASHPERTPGGLGRLERTARRVDVPVIAIGGVTPSRVSEAVMAGARGVAVLSGVWDADDPVAAAGRYLEELAGGADDGDDDDDRGHAER